MNCRLLVPAAASEPTTVVIAGVALTLDPSHKNGPWWRGAGDNAAWRYTSPTDYCIGQYGCSLHFGPACIGGVAPTLEALDALVRERIEAARLVFVAMPVAP